MLATWPLARNLSSTLPADPTERANDIWQHVWNLWWLRQALLVEHTSPFYTHALFYPQGASLGLHTLNLPFGLAGLPLLPLLGIVTTYNLLIMLTLMLAGYTAFLLARHVSGSVPAALLAGTVVLISPMRLDQARLALLATFNDFAVPLALLALLLALERPTRRAIVLSASALLLTGLSNWYHLFHTTLLCAMLAAWRLAGLWRAGEQARLRSELITWARVALLSGLLIGPFLLPGFIEALTSTAARKGNLMSSADVARLVDSTPGFLWQPVAPDWWEGYFFALPPLLLALVGLAAAPRQTRLWALMAAVFLLLSLGPTLRIGGADTGIPMPYALLDALPVVNVMRGPARLNAITTLMLAIITAAGWAQLFRRMPAPAGWIGAGAAMLLVVATVVRLPFPLRDATVSPFYEQVAAEPGRWGLLELPFARPDRSLRDMYTQSHHGKYIYTGHLSREVPAIPYEYAPPIAQAEHGTTGPDIVSMTAAERDQLLRSLRARYLLLHTSTRSPERTARQAAAARSSLGAMSQVYAGEELIVYRLDDVAAWLDSAAAAKPVAVPLFLGLDGRWGEPETDAQGVSRWLPSAGGGLWTYTAHPRRVVLELTLSSLPGARPLDLRLNGRPIQMLPIAAGAPRRYLSAPIELPAGPSLLELSAPAGGVSPQSLGQGDDTRLLSFRVQRLRLRELLP